MLVNHRITLSIKLNSQVPTWGQKSTERIKCLIQEFEPVASSRPSVSWGSARKTKETRCEEAKERLWGNLIYKRSDDLQRPVTWLPACGFQLSTFLWNMITEYQFKLCPSKANTLQSKRSVYRKQNWRQTCGCHEPYLQIFSHNLALSGSSRLNRGYLLPLLRLRFCSTVQLGTSLWPRELDKPPWKRRRRRLLNSSERFLKSSSIDHVFMQSFYS